MLSHDPVALGLVALALAVLVAHLANLLLPRLGQPAVMGEILGGIVLGPTVLGALPGNPSTYLLPLSVRPVLSVIGNLALVLFMFTVGLELDLGAVRRGGRTVAAVSAGAVAVPFALGIGLATVLYSSHAVVAGHAVGRAAFVLFIATALSITAFPVLARIVRDSRLSATRIGTLAITSSAIQDLAGWLLLAISLAAAQRTGPGGVIRLTVEATGFGVVLMVAIRPAMKRVAASAGPDGTLPPGAMAIVLGTLVACGGFTQLIGLHCVVGAFAVGLAFPRTARSAVSPSLRRALQPALLLLLPIYFLVPGLSTNLRLLDSHMLWQFGLILACACGGKLIGTALPARARGMTWRDTCELGVMLNTRGAIELIVLTVGFQRHILDQRLFSAMVLMAVVTTFATGPALTALGFQRRRHEHVTGVEPVSLV